MTKTSIKDIEKCPLIIEECKAEVLPYLQMIEKQITFLIPKSQEQNFNQLTQGFKEFTLKFYDQEETFEHKTLSIGLTSTQLKK